VTVTSAMQANVRDYDIAGIISQSPWFQGLPEKALTRLAEAARIRSFRKKSYLYTSGEKGSEVYCLLAGRVRLLLTSAIGQEYAVTDYDAGTWLGGEFLSGDNPARLDVQINETATVLTLPRTLVLEIANEYPDVFKRLFSDYMVRFAGLMLLLQGMAFYPLRARLAGWLIELLEKHGQKEEAGVYLDTRLSQNDLAQLSLGSRQRINKILSEWRERGIIEVEGSRYLVRDMSALVHETELQDRDD
jgi:CRP/FNR family cyclic AMP-dependent transcriptional regulator